MKFLRYIIIFSLILNLGTQAALPCDMKSCKISNKVISCCKKEAIQQSECCCAKMECKTTTKYNDELPPVSKLSISLQFEYLFPQKVLGAANKTFPFNFSFIYFHWANPPSKNNIPLLT